jgi:predicted Zn-dependent peptidase
MTANIEELELPALDRSRPPAPGTPKDIKFPDFFEAVTDNGITVLVIQDTTFPLVSTRFVYKSGSFNDKLAGTNKLGLSSLTSELITKGTSKKNATQIAQEVDYLGAVLSSGCDYDASYVSSYSLKKHFDKIFEITTDVILNPVFPEDEIKRLKEQRLNSLLSYKDEGDYLASRVFKKYVYNDSPYANPIEGTEDSLPGLTFDDFRSYHKKYYIPNNLIAAFVGDITPEEAMRKVNETFGNIKKADVQPMDIKMPFLNQEPAVYIIEKKAAVQSSIKMGHIGINRKNPDFIATSVLNTLLGGSFTSRINKNLREVNGYTYGARSYFDWKKFSGDFSVETEVKNDITINAVQEIIKEITLIRENLVGEDELQHIKNFITGNFPLQLETPNAIASKLINLKLYDIEDDFYSTYITNVNKITREQIKAAAEKYLYPDNLTISIAGNPDDIAEPMKQIAEVTVLKEL